ncbi:hypothetical protein ACHQM5_019764 [Ranunculus cassubicifolius]
MKESTASNEETPKILQFDKQALPARVPYATVVTDIFGVDGTPPEASAAKPAPKSEEPGTYKLTKREKKALEAAPGFKSKHPWFAVPMVKSHKHQLILPFKFVKEYLPKESMNAKIVDSNERTWEIEYKYKKGRSLLYTGWNSFWLCNELKEGDVCAFELIDKKDVKFRVTIRKKEI